MHVIIINGSPRVQKLSNTAKIIQSFGKGLQAAGASYELYSLSDRREWDAARDAFMGNEQIIFALPLYVECVPSIMLEFLESLPTERRQPALMSFILHGGFDEGHQFRLCERFLQSLPSQLGCTYGGCLIQGGSFMIRLRDDEKMKKAMDKKLDGYTESPADSPAPRRIHGLSIFCSSYSSSALYAIISTILPNNGAAPVRWTTNRIYNRNNEQQSTCR